MLAEGTLKTTTQGVNGGGVARQAASLPSSSKQSTDSKPVISEEEGTNVAANRPVDTITLSDAADASQAQASTQGPALLNGEVNPSDSENTDQIDSRSSDESQDAREAREAKEAEEERSRLEAISEEAQAKLLNENISLRFRKDEDTGEDLFQFVDKGSGDVVRQIPAEEAVEFLKKFETVSGLLFSEQA